MAENVGYRNKVRSKAGWGAVAAGAAMVATLLAAPGAAAATPVLDGGADLAEAVRLEERIVDNLRVAGEFGGSQLFEVDYATPARNLGEVVQTGDYADSALWTNSGVGNAPVNP